MSAEHAQCPAPLKKRVPIACLLCRRRKVRCETQDASTPCKRCVRKGLDCAYVPVAEDTGRGQPRKPVSQEHSPLMIPTRHLQVSYNSTPNANLTRSESYYSKFEQSPALHLPRNTVQSHPYSNLPNQPLTSLPNLQYSQNYAQNTLPQTQIWTGDMPQVTGQTTHNFSSWPSESYAARTSFPASMSHLQASTFGSYPVCIVCGLSPCFCARK